MRFANHEGRRVEAKPGATGTCPACKSDLTAKCGDIRIWHWSHKRNASCDARREAETEWHRAWKGKFPNDWTEQLVLDCFGHKYFADVRTPNGLVIEFQHSSLSLDDMYLREDCHRNMAWVVDGLRLKTGADILKRLASQSPQSSKSGHISLWKDLYSITRRWQLSCKFMFLDFGDDHLWCISPHKDLWGSLAARVTKDRFVESVLAGHLPIETKALEQAAHLGSLLITPMRK